MPQRAIAMAPRKLVALIAHDNCKSDLLEWANEHFEVPGVLSFAANLGTGLGIGTFNSPAFDNWSAEFDAHFFPSLLDRQQVVDFYKTAGFMKGLGDWRPQNGTFEVEMID